jgi:hypothetical protein
MTEPGVMLGQRAVENKSKGTPAILQLLELLVPRGCLVWRSMSGPVSESLPNRGH